MNKKQRILAIFTLGLVLFTFVSVTSRVFASDITPTGGEPSISNQIKGNSTLDSGATPTETKPSGVGLIFGAINAFIGFIGGGLFSLAGGLTNYALLLNFDIFNNPIIDVGWGIARDLANLGFVLFIIIIAIATILRIQQYGAKSALGTLIAVALLVNFSLFFAGIFINFSNMLTNYFIKSITANNDIGGLGPSLAGAFRIQNLLDVKNATEMGAMQGVTQFGKSMLIGVASSFFVAAFTLIGAFSLLTLAIMFMVRYLALSILLILVPLAFLFIILPDTRKLWTQWISEFMKWIIFAPTASFFLYLAVYMTVNYGKMLDNLAAQSQDIGTANQMSFANLTINQPLQTIGRMLIIIGLLLGGLIVANSTGAMGAKYGIAAARAARKWVKGTVGGLAAGGTQRFAMGGGRTTTNAAGQTEFTTRGQRMATAISQIPGFKGVAQRMSAFSSPQTRAADVEKYRAANVAHLSNEAFLRMAASNLAFTNPTQAAAFAQDAARRNLTNDPRLVPYLQRYLQTAQRMGNINTILANRPDLAPAVGQTIEQAMQRIRADKADEISHDALGQVNVVLNFDNSKLRRIGTVGDDRQKQAIENAVNAAINNINNLTPQQQAALNRIEAQIRTLQNGGNW